MSQPTAGHRSRRRGLLIAALAAVPLILAFQGARWFHERQLSALFSGPMRTAPSPAAMHRGFCPTAVYDLKYWHSGPGSSGEESTPSALEDLRPREPSQRYEYVDGAGRDEFEAMMHRSPLVDAASGATKIVRLQSPTVYRESYLSDFLTITDPPDNALFPPNLCPPFVEWSDRSNDLWQVTVSAGDAPAWTGLSRERRARIPDDVWRRLTSPAQRGRTATLRVKGIRRSGLWGRKGTAVDVSQAVRFSVSSDPADPAVIYRLVAPPFINKKTPDMFIRHLGEKEPRPFLLARRQYCFNCHTIAQGPQGVEKLALQVRYLGREKQELPVYVALYDVEKQRAVRAALPFKVQMTTFMAWSPDGTKLALSANQSLVTLPPIVHETQFAGEATSDIAVYDTETDSARLIEGAATAENLEIYPRWTPDGKAIVFCRAPAGAHPALTKFQLWVVPYNDGAGGKAVPIPGAQDPARSSYFPRFSPDGRWFTFVRSDGGSLIKSSSDIWIMPWGNSKPEKRNSKEEPASGAQASGDSNFPATARAFAETSEFRVSDFGAARPLECNAPFAADSWHSWSSNSRWIIFASKRDDGIYARLYMTRIDDDGRATPAVRLPVTDPPLMSFNIPEFVTQPPKLSERELFDSVGIRRDVVYVKEQR